MTTAIAVPFHGTELYVVDHGGQPFTPMKPIVDGMGLAWQTQHRKIATNDTRWGITEMVIPTSGGNQAMVCMPLRKLPGWLMTIHPNKVKAERREAIIRFQNECDDVLWDYWTKGQASRQEGVKETLMPSPTLTASDQQTLSEIVDFRARDFGTLAGKAKSEIWSRVHRKFRVAKYQQLPRDQLSDAITYVMNMDIRTKAPALPSGQYDAPLSMWKLSNRKGATGWLTYSELNQVDGPMRPISTVLRGLTNGGHDVSGAQAEYDAMRLLLEYYHWRLDTIATIFRQMDGYGLNISQH
jgi:hypothetical protein